MKRQSKRSVVEKYFSAFTKWHLPCRLGHSCRASWDSTFFYFM